MKLRIKTEYLFFAAVFLLVGAGLGLSASKFSFRFIDLLYRDYNDSIVLERHRIKRRDSLEENITRYAQEYFLGSFYHNVLDPVLPIDTIKEIVVFDTTLLIDLSTEILKETPSTEEFQLLKELLQRGLRRTFRVDCDVRFLLEGNEFTNISTSFVGG